MTHTQQILADIKRHGILTAAAIHNVTIDHLFSMAAKGKKT